jgi:Flp pilus assembly protein TadG
MRFSSARRSRKSGSIMVLFTLMLPTLLLPLAGLAIDASIARLMQIRLQAAVDGAAIGAGRLLGTPAVPETLAKEFLLANFPTDHSAGTWNANNLQYTIVYTPGITKKIDVSATASVPLLFLRIFGVSSASIAAVGTATRSDSRVVFVIDRSGSMNTDDGTGKSTVIADAIFETQKLVAGFTEGTDELGLVVFDGSAVVGYPTYAAGGWTPTISMASTGGPNNTFNDGTANDMVTQIKAITALNGTGMAEALSIAYIELQKAHMRDLADPVNKGVDARLNSIVLLTDGLPTAISLYLNNPNPNNTNANNIVSTTACTYKTITGTPTAANMMQSWFALAGTAPFGSNGTAGVEMLASLDTAHNSNWWMGNGGQDAVKPNPTSPYGPYNNCPNMQGGSTAQSYFSKIPDVDFWGNATTGSGYKKSHITGNPAATTVWTSGDQVMNKPTNVYQWALAMWNSVDNAAKNIRSDANLATRTLAGDTGGNMGIQIYVIGYSGNQGGCDDGLLKRVANDPKADGFDNTQVPGKYYPASDGASLDDAFNQLASDLLRLAR